MSHPSDFFTAGGTLRARAPSYVTRPADQELFEHTLAGEFCYVLTPRQMGKSSLMIRTARRLAEAGRKVAILDLTGIGSGSADQWYLGLLEQMARDLRLNVDVPDWWQEHTFLTIPQRFSEFLRDVVLQQLAGPIVIFIDEIDSTLKLDFRDDFFAAIRAIYNARASESAYKRLTFALLGVATPTDLIKERERTPFNIGRRIVLQEFSYGEARSLLTGLEACHPGQGETILRRIFDWTNGYPYLTQKLCLAAAERPAADWDAAQVDELVETTFFSEVGRKDPNFKFVQQRIQESSVAERRQMLNLYRKVYGGKEMLDDDRSQSQNHLELYGLVRAERGKLSVRNDIYRRIFDGQWIGANTPANRDLRWAIGASVIALMAIVALWFYIRLPPSPSALLYIRQFNDNPYPTARIEALAGLFGLQDSLYDRDDEQGLRLFYTLNITDQLTLFSETNARLKSREMTTAIRRISLTLDEQNASSLAVMSKMITALGAIGQKEANSVAEELINWKSGRQRAGNGQYQGATSAYSATLRLNPDNLAARYDRASAFTKLVKYGEALQDLNQIIVIAKTAAPASTPTPTAVLPPISGAAITGVPLASSAVGIPNGTAFSTTAVPTITATSVITSTPQVGAGSSRFISTELIIKAVADTVQGNKDLMNYLRNPQNQTAYQDLSETLGLSNIAQERTPLLPSATATISEQSTSTGDSLTTTAPEDQSATAQALQEAQTVTAQAIQTATVTTPAIQEAQTATAQAIQTAMAEVPTFSPLPTLLPTLVPTRPPLPAVNEEFERQAIILINQQRGANGCSVVLRYSPELTAAARRHTIDMATNNRYELTGSDGTNVTTWAREAGYFNRSGKRVRVNIAISSSPELLVDGLMGTDITRLQILDCTFNDIGVGYAVSGGSSNISYWTVLVGLSS
jgi:uncharacterized protein YkwD